MHEGGEGPLGGEGILGLLVLLLVLVVEMGNEGNVLGFEELLALLVHVAEELLELLDELQGLG